MSGISAWIEPSLQCPECGSEIIRSANNSFSCSTHGEFKVVDDILCFSPMSHFDEHWVLNNLEAIPTSKIEAAKKFIPPVINAQKPQQEMHLLDVGCGDGVHVHALNQSIEKLKPIGIDISLPALKIAKQRDNKHQWNFMKADAGALPFTNDSFDTVISYGVLAYTANPKTSFSEMCRVAKPGGLIGVWIYPRLGGLKGFVFNSIRALSSMLGTNGATFIANLIVPFIGVLPTSSKISLSNASWRECREIIMVNIFPKHLIFPTQSEVEQWFNENDISIIYSDSTSPITIWGTKNGTND
jgi:ubiquinone/menaquinone biosynthesis C-methylase UbiE